MSKGLTWCHSTADHLCTRGGGDCPMWTHEKQA